MLIAHRKVGAARNDKLAVETHLRFSLSDGALLAGRLLAPLVGGVPGQGFFTVSAVLLSLFGAVVLVALVNLLRRGQLR